MNRTTFYLTLSLLWTVNMHAQNEPSIGTEKVEVLRLFGQRIQEETASGDLFLQMPFYGHPANVFVGFKDGKAFTISVSFRESPDRIGQLMLFRDVRKQLEALSGNQYSYARIEGVDVLGESGGWIPDKRKNNAFVFGTTRNGLVYQVEIVSESIGYLAKTGEVRLTIDKEESLQSPSSKGDG